MGNSIKPPSVQAAVVAKSLAGESKLQIAQDLGIARGTVYKILDSAEMGNLLLEGKSGIFSLIPKSVKAIETALDKGDTGEAKMILRSVGILPEEHSGNAAFTANVNLGVFADR